MPFHPVEPPPRASSRSDSAAGSRGGGSECPWAERGWWKRRTPNQRKRDEGNDEPVLGGEDRGAAGREAVRRAQLGGLLRGVPQHRPSEPEGDPHRLPED